MFNSIFTTSTLTLENVILCILTAIILGLINAFVYMKTSRYSKNFVLTLTLLPLLVFAVMVMVNGNLGTSVAVLGAFSLIRFRSVPGTSKEILSIFLAMALGLAIGMGQLTFSILITLITDGLILLLDFLKFGEKKEGVHHLKIVVPEDLDYENIFDEIIDKYVTKKELISVKTINMGSLYELTYEVTLDLKNSKLLIDELRIRNGNLKINLTREVKEQYEL